MGELNEIIVGAIFGLLLSGMVISCLVLAWSADGQEQRAAIRPADDSPEKSESFKEVA